MQEVYVYSVRTVPMDWEGGFPTRPGSPNETSCGAPIDTGAGTRLNEEWYALRGVVPGTVRQELKPLPVDRDFPLPTMVKIHAYGVRLNTGCSARHVSSSVVETSLAAATMGAVNDGTVRTRIPYQSGEFRLIVKRNCITMGRSWNPPPNPGSGIGSVASTHPRRCL